MYAPLYLHIIVYDFSLQFYFYFSVYYRAKIEKTKSQLRFDCDNTKAENIPAHRKLTHTHIVYNELKIKVDGCIQCIIVELICALPFSSSIQQLNTKLS